MNNHKNTRQHFPSTYQTITTPITITTFDISPRNNHPSNQAIHSPLPNGIPTRNDTQTKEMPPYPRPCETRPFGTEGKALDFFLPTKRGHSSPEGRKRVTPLHSPTTLLLFLPLPHSHTLSLSLSLNDSSRKSNTTTTYTHTPQHK